MALLFKGSFLVLFAFLLALVPVGAEGNGPVLHRQKRHWISAPRHLKENHDYTGYQYIAKIRSDKENYTKIFYSLSGPGVNKPPLNVFRVDQNTGWVKIYSILDREERAEYNLKGKATFSDGSPAETDIDLKITVDDVNDCPPVIKVQQTGAVKESSAAGTVVMKVIATDADQEGTAHSKIFYKIASESNPDGMFYINSQTGEVMVQKISLDRETRDSYKLTIIASDMNGQPGGKTGTGEVQVKILDINDNVPVLEKESYEGRVEENTINREVMRFKTIDMDLANTDNWLADFKILSGNEAGYFKIITDRMTNEGVLIIQKALNYEELKAVNLEVAVNNKAAYDFGARGAGESVAQKAYGVKVNVDNQNEGPRFHPDTKVVSLSEDHSSIDLTKIIANYAAIDTDTQQTVTNVRYAKIQDDDNWLIIDEKTADIWLNKMPDRESKFLKNGTYYAKVICTTNDLPTKTATGTIAIQVEDFNDHCPILTSAKKTMCHWENFIYVTAEDQDDFPNSAPYDFTVIEESSKGKWVVEPLNETTVILRDHANLWPGSYKVTVQIKDQQGKSCEDVQTMDVVVCTCHDNTKTCVPRAATSKNFSASGILLLLLGLLLLLLVPLLLLFCLCGGAAGAGDFKPIPYDTKQQLISYHTEGQGEDKEIPLLHTPLEMEHAAIKAKDINNYRSGQGDLIDMRMGPGAGGFGGDIMTLDHRFNRYGEHIDMEHVDSGLTQGHYSEYRGGLFDGMALSSEFLGEYYSNKSSHAAQQYQEKNAVLVYDYEGQGSPAGSVGCCSLQENDDDLTFLNDLGPKFKTLAEICKGSAIVTESVRAGVSVPPPKAVSPVQIPPSTHTHVRTHTETVRDRDRVNINHAANVAASGSSAFIQEERVSETFQGSASLPKVQVQDKIMVPSQTVLVQQPAMYYTTTPMYVVEPKPQMVLVSGAAQQAVGQVGMSPGLVQVGGMQAPQGVVLVDRQVGGLAGRVSHVSHGLSQGIGSRSGQVLVENVSLGGQQLAHVAPSFVQVQQVPREKGSEFKSQGKQVKTQSYSLASLGSVGSSELLVDSGSLGGQQVAHLAPGFVQVQQVPRDKGSEFRSQGKQVKTQSYSRTSRGSTEDYAQITTPKIQSSQRVVVQQKKVLVSDSNPGA